MHLINQIKQIKQIIQSQKLNIDFNLPDDSLIKEFQDKVNWSDISKYQTLSEDFIEEFHDKVEWFRISMYQKLSEETETANYYKDQLISNYLFKGPVLEWYMKVKLKLEGPTFNKLVFEGQKRETAIARNGGIYNDKEKDINYVRSSNKKVLVREFVKKKEIDDKLKRIAESVDEKYMGFVF